MATIWRGRKRQAKPSATQVYLLSTLSWAHHPGFRHLSVRSAWPQARSRSETSSSTRRISEMPTEERGSIGRPGAISTQIQTMSHADTVRVGGKRRFGKMGSPIRSQDQKPIPTPRTTERFVRRRPNLRRKAIRFWLVAGEKSVLSKRRAVTRIVAGRISFMKLRK